ncbi:hypothetical protein FK220_001450 [Flavobacteriaceae bacterium TP-CH-4]|uniref:Carboxypeptidase regulatory-like domain-containing protein n=1 Tax=Pelagihabitans pacificus TaxID=2696054 RepID=A0A967AWN7_9FLAO|nr:hypothetical protein [Pelagihabitans pacificus]NHF57986.1 hypothetical protein [Pelagihabitans pacificus]
MGYLISGNLSGSLPRSSFEFLSNVSVKIYRTQKGKDNLRPPKGVKGDIQVLDGNEVAFKRELLVGEGTTDANGYYKVKLADTYNRGPVSIDVVITEVPYQKGKQDKRVQCLVKTLQPFWRKQSEHHHFSFNYRFPYEFWGVLRAQFDAWMIFGHVKSTGNIPTVEGLRVTAYDVDWITDDLLGTAVTDSSGFFRIDYTSSDFKKTFLTPLINVETPLTALPGPGVYFKIASKEGDLLLEEASTMGKTDERKNVPHCYYVELSINTKR